MFAVKLHSAVCIYYSANMFHLTFVFLCVCLLATLHKSSDANKDLGFKTKAKDRGQKAKAKDLAPKTMAKDSKCQGQWEKSKLAVITKFIFTQRRRQENSPGGPSFCLGPTLPPPSHSLPPLSLPSHPFLSP